MSVLNSKHLAPVFMLCASLVVASCAQKTFRQEGAPTGSADISSYRYFNIVNWGGDKTVADAIKINMSKKGYSFIREYETRKHTHEGVLNINCQHQGNNSARAPLGYSQIFSCEIFDETTKSRLYAGLGEHIGNNHKEDKYGAVKAALLNLPSFDYERHTSLRAGNNHIEAKPSPKPSNQPVSPLTNTPAPKVIITKTSKPTVLQFKKVSKRPDDVAVIIANSNYTKLGRDIPNVDPAYNDGENIKRYFMDAKGIREGNIIYLKDATGAQLTEVFGNERNHKAQLYNWVKPNTSNVDVYYVGHGAPASNDGSAFLVLS